MQPRPLRYVITGAPGAGKTTLIRSLERRGFSVVCEVGRALIEDQRRAGGKLLPWIDRDGFQREILRRRLQVEAVEVNGPLFLDRGIPDGIAYYQFDALMPPQNLIHAARLAQYAGVFLLEPLDTYTTDAARHHSQEDALRLHHLIRGAYATLDYAVEPVPAMPVREREEYILRHICIEPV